MVNLTGKKCIACEGTEVPFRKTEAEVLLKQVPGWELSENVKKISRKFKFKNFADALSFVNKVGVIAENEGHHPDISLGWGRVGIELTTHAIKGLSENDFILAAKIHQL